MLKAIDVRASPDGRANRAGRSCLRVCEDSLAGAVVRNTGTASGVGQITCADLAHDHASWNCLMDRPDYKNALPSQPAEQMHAVLQTTMAMILCALLQWHGRSGLQRRVRPSRGWTRQAAAHRDLLKRSPSCADPSDSGVRWDSHVHPSGSHVFEGRVIPWS